MFGLNVLWCRDFLARPASSGWRAGGWKRGQGLHPPVKASNVELVWGGSLPRLGPDCQEHQRKTGFGGGGDTAAMEVGQV